MTDRLSTNQYNNITAADIIDGELVFKRYDGSTLIFGDLAYVDPEITSLTPNTVVAASGLVTINVAGEGFVADATIEINQIAVPTTFVSSVLLTTPYDPISSGTFEFTVRQDPHESNSLLFTVT